MMVQLCRWGRLLPESHAKEQEQSPVLVGYHPAGPSARQEIVTRCLSLCVCGGDVCVCGGGGERGAGNTISNSQQTVLMGPACRYIHCVSGRVAATSSCSSRDPLQAPLRAVKFWPALRYTPL